MTKYKTRYLPVIMILFIISFIFAGCNRDGGFIDVSSVTFTSGGQTRTVYSTWYIGTGNFEVATKSEYGSAKFKTSVMASNTVDVNTISMYTSDCFSGNINIRSTKTNPYNITQNDIGKYFYIYAHDLGDFTKSYYKVKIKDVGAYYAQVKVINNTTIVIKKGPTETTYTVTSYSLRK